ncbi:PEP-CTERM sorting domain-containing protein [Paraglaciecola marina]|uniref:PEP-CTERM sorting domain-containing protein n=1 Tax=Paraglaciecola marina TaxID=2500157 RepID=UPI0010618A1B|nr:PEP-CTERM sorting domain-containing protein [Paraglaciecola marina]
MNVRMLKMAGAGIALSISSFANAVLVLQVDLSVENSITISATSGTSLATVSGSDFTGFLLTDFFDSSFEVLGGTYLTSGNLSSANNTSNGIPLIYSHLADTGLNIWTFTDDPSMTFTAGELAFSGQGNWAVTSAMYVSALNGAQSGNVYAPADSIDDIGGAGLIGTWAVVGAEEVPAPSTPAILGLALMGLALRRLKK